MAIIDSNAHVDVAIGILQNLYLNLILLGLELDLISSHVGQLGGELGTRHCRPSFHLGFQNGSPLFPLFHSCNANASSPWLGDFECYRDFSSIENLETLILVDKLGRKSF